MNWVTIRIRIQNGINHNIEDATNRRNKKGGVSRSSLSHLRDNVGAHEVLAGAAHDPWGERGPRSTKSFGGGTLPKKIKTKKTSKNQKKI